MASIDNLPLLPEGFVNAFISAEAGHHVYSRDHPRKLLAAMPPRLMQLAMRYRF